MPLPAKSRSSARARSRAGRGRVAGPALKFMGRRMGAGTLAEVRSIVVPRKSHPVDGVFTQSADYTGGLSEREMLKTFFSHAKLEPSMRTLPAAIVLALVCAWTS